MLHPNVAWRILQLEHATEVSVIVLVPCRVRVHRHGLARDNGMFAPELLRHVLDQSKLLAVASAIGLQGNSFATHLEAAKAEVISQVEDASRRGILGSPVIFLNGTRVDGLQGEAFYTAILDRELAGTATVAQR